MRCTKCKKQLRKGAKFCPVCGAKVKKQSGTRFTSILLIIVLLSIAVVGLGGSIMLAKNGGSLEGFFSKNKSIEIHSAEEAIAHAKELGEDYGYENALSELTEKVTTTIAGDSYYRLQQNYQGIPVYGRSIMYSTDSTGRILSVVGNVSDVETLRLIPDITESQAFNAIQDYALHNLDLDDSDVVRESLSKEDLCIYNLGDSGHSHLAYQFYCGDYEYIVDAHSAEVLFANSLIRYADVQGPLVGQFRAYPNIHFDQGESRFSLTDSTRNVSAYITDTSSLVVWDANESPNASAVDAFVNIQTAYDFYHMVVGNTSYDGNGEKPIRVIVNVSDLNDNASYSPSSGVFKFGTANVYKYDKTAYLDWVAHEYTHGVEQMHSSMQYCGESGAIMEALSDIFGEIIESWRGIKNSKSIFDEPNWHFTETQRYISDPEKGGCPQQYKDGRYWKNTALITKDNDWGGVHHNSTVISHTAYLMWNGGVDGNDTKKIESEDLAKLWYRAMLMMPSDCSFVECRTLVELAASSMNLKDSQIQCISEAFDAVGIPRASESEYSRLVHYAAAGDTSIKGTIYEVQMVNGVETVIPLPNATVAVYSSKSEEAINEVSMTDKKGFFEIKLPAGTYSVSVSADGYIGETVSFELRDQEVRYLQFALDPSKNASAADGKNDDAYNAYVNAVNQTIKSGSWSEDLTMTANMAITKGKARAKTKMTMNSASSVSNYSESDPSRVRISGSTDMTVMGQTYAWETEYENGIAHYRYSKPNQTSVDMAIDPSFFNFRTMTSDMMSNAKVSGNTITFTVPGEKITEVGIAAVNQMSGVDDLEYGDVDVTVTISADGKIDTITMVFHASMEYQGNDAEADYNIAYSFSDNSDTPSIPISGEIAMVPGFYAQEGSNYDYDALTIYESDGITMNFSVFWYDLADISNANAILSGNTASFDYTYPNGTWQVAGTLQSPAENTVVLTISDSTNEYIDVGEYRYFLIGRKFTNAELKAISAALNVPDDLDTEITQYEPAYWEGGGIYRTPIEIHYNGELIAGASVNSLTGELAGAIYKYSGNTNVTTKISEAEAHSIACEYWDYTEGAIDEETGYELTLSYDGLIEGSDNAEYYAFRLCWFVPSSGHSSTLEYLYVNAETGACKYSVD